jgi:hypothetical protein
MKSAIPKSNTLKSIALSLKLKYNKSYNINYGLKRKLF